jgi:sugar phosphate isomerase/epimerase
VYRNLMEILDEYLSGVGAYRYVLSGGLAVLVIAFVLQLVPPWRRAVWDARAGRGWKAVLLALASALLVCLGRPAASGDDAAAPAGAAGFSGPLFALDNAFFAEGKTRKLWKPFSAEEQAAILQELGYAGMSWRPGGTDEIRAALEAKGLRLFAFYVDLSLPPEELREAVQKLKGTGALIWLTVRRENKGPEATIVERVRAAGETAEAAGLRVALYPHVGFRVATTEEALRLAEQTGRANVGVSFNLGHCVLAGNEERIPAILKRAFPRLFVVTLSGADSRAKDVVHSVYTLDRGTLDLRPTLRALKTLNYTGPIGLQCFSIPGDARENLRRSMDAWRRLTAQAAAEPCGSAPDASGSPKTQEGAGGGA